MIDSREHFFITAAIHVPVSREKGYTCASPRRSLDGLRRRLPLPPFLLITLGRQLGISEWNAAVEPYRSTRVRPKRCNALYLKGLQIE